LWKFRQFYKHAYDSEDCGKISPHTYRRTAEVEEVVAKGTRTYIYALKRIFEYINNIL